MYLYLKNDVYLIKKQKKTRILNKTMTRHYMNYGLLLIRGISNCISQLIDY